MKSATESLFTITQHAMEERRPRDSLIISLPQHDVLLNLHHFDMVEVPRPARHDPPLRIDLALLDHPRLRPVHELLREPARDRARLLDQAGGLQGPRVRHATRDHVTCEDVGCVGVGIPQEEGQRDRRPGITIQNEQRLASAMML